MGVNSLNVPIFCMVCVLLTAGKLGDTANTVASSDDDDNDDSGSSSDDNDAVAEFFGDLLVDLIEAIIDAHRNCPVKTRVGFLKYPYASGLPGYYVSKMEMKPTEDTAQNDVIDESSITEQTPDVDLHAPVEPWFYPTQASEDDRRPVSLTIATDYMYDLDGVHIPQIRAFLDTQIRLGFRVNTSFFLEPLDDTVDRLLLSEYLVNIRLLSNIVGIHVGGGLLSFSYHGETVWGGAATINMDVFLVRPIVFQADLLAGMINEAAYTSARVTLGVIWRHLEVFAGYEYRSFKSAAETDVVTYGGPSGGIKLWF